MFTEVTLSFPLHVYLIGTETVRLEDGGAKKKLPLYPWPHKSLKEQISEGYFIITEL